MGTSYTLYEDDGSCEVVIDEMSNKLDLSIFVANYGHNAVISTGSMEPRQMLKLLMEGIKATSYWMEEKEFNEAFSKLEVYPL
jgi:hypothetical protein